MYSYISFEYFCISAHTHTCTVQLCVCLCLRASANACVLSLSKAFNLRQLWLPRVNAMVYSASAVVCCAQLIFEPAVCNIEQLSAKSNVSLLKYFRWHLYYLIIVVVAWLLISCFFVFEKQFSNLWQVGASAQLVTWPTRMQCGTLLQIAHVCGMCTLNGISMLAWAYPDFWSCRVRPCCRLIWSLVCNFQISKTRKQ